MPIKSTTANITMVKRLFHIKITMNLDVAIQSLDTGFTRRSFIVLSVYSRPKIQQVVKANPIIKIAEKFFRISAKYDSQLTFASP
jgi:hypothetical protein